MHRQDAAVNQILLVRLQIVGGRQSARLEQQHREKPEKGAAEIPVRVPQPPEGQQKKKAARQAGHQGHPLAVPQVERP